MACGGRIAQSEGGPLFRNGLKGQAASQGSLCHASSKDWACPVSRCCPEEAPTERTPAGASHPTAGGVPGMIDSCQQVRLSAAGESGSRSIAGPGACIRWADKPTACGEGAAAHVGSAGCNTCPAGQEWRSQSARRPHIEGRGSSGINTTACFLDGGATVEFYKWS
ncbi:hypothetical protein NDU88_004760 [Pleurodeles waltl]|uniref:Uncharacterized protein n=1 Tax=Pleurodeles waltl TaxID=8319 RepID=A0AAV7L1V7_PLEWA|nr:hypothetical protein NDU88_004760 [Pleurodeles waltl]